MQKIYIGTRKSRLAVVQAESVAEYIRQFCEGREPELVTVHTTGDRILDRSLAQIGGKGLFVRELELSLREKCSDISVHSMKDVPMEVPQDLPILGVSVREDVRDVLVLPKGTTTLNPSLPLGTSSPRRTIQLRKLFPEMEIKDVRGNVQTRLAKLDGGEYSGLVLAAAGLTRLGLTDRISRYFAVEEILPAAGQGALAIQGRRDEDYGYLNDFFDLDTALCVMAERSFVRALNGGCSSPVAAYARIVTGKHTGKADTDSEDIMLKLTGLYAEEGSRDYRIASIMGEKKEAKRLGRELAGQMEAGW